MAIVRTYQQMQYQIAQDLGNKTDLLTVDPDFSSVLTMSPIQDAIQQAIAFWERERFYFNELVIDRFNWTASNWATSPGQEFYGDTTTPVAWTNPLASSIAGIDSMNMLINNNSYKLTFRTYQYISEIAVNQNLTGQSVDVTYAGEMFRFNEIPAGAWPIFIMGTYRLPTLVNPTDTNAWMYQGYDLIRCQAMLKLAEETLQDPDLAAAMRRAIYGDTDVPSRRGYLDTLKAERTERSGRSKVVPTYF